jgi:N-acetylmuramoyl-L-alanine amidase
MTRALLRGRLPALGALVAAAGLALAASGCGGTARAVGVAGATQAPTPTPAQAPTPTPAPAPTPALPRAASGPAARAPVKPLIVSDPIPFGARRKAEMVAYAERHYHLRTYRLIHPQVIVEHYTETPDFSSTFNTFAPDVPDSELHELPNTCAHFVVDRDGTIHQLVPTTIMCRHTVGLNWTAIGIENVGYSDAEILGRPRELRASLALTRWLRCRYGIAIRNVIGHNESLSSPFHHEDVAALRTQTHGDWTRADMQVYRARLRSLGGC